MVKLLGGPISKSGHRNKAELGARARRRARRQAIIDEYGLDPDNIYIDALIGGSRKRGAQPGNLNALKHGKRSKVVSHTRKVVEALRDGLNSGLSGAELAAVAKGYERALRWSQDDLASLQLAVVHKADITRWRLEVAHALRDHRPPPLPPAAILSRRQQALYTLYVEQRRLLRETLTPSTGTLLAYEERIERAAAAALADLEEWRLVSDILGPAAAEACNIDVPASRRSLVALLHTNEQTNEQSAFSGSQSTNESPDD